MFMLIGERYRLRSWPEVRACTEEEDNDKQAELPPGHWYQYKAFGDFKWRGPDTASV